MSSSPPLSLPSSPPLAFTPQRRRREEDEEESMAENTTYHSAISRASKRQRQHEDINDDDDQSEDGPLLPDNFRRSPKGKGRAIDADSATNSLQEHHPGSIVRVTMKTFVTYTHAEFLPGPNLNMIIGPNGTGKSTLVCAICLGLGWKPEHLGRSKDIAEFVKHGAREATIEIELKADTDIHPTNPIITCIISREGGKSDDKKTAFKIDGRKVSRKAVQDLVKKNYSIQVDNLCQFLPQDRVVEFAALSPVELLVQTQRAAAPEYMSEWHEQLKTMRKDQREKQIRNQSLLETLKQLEDRHKAQANDVEKMRQQEVLRARLNGLEKMRPYCEYVLILRNFREAKERKKAATLELSNLRRRAEPNLKAMNDKIDYTSKVERVLTQRSRLVENTERKLAIEHKNLKDFDQKIEGCQQEVQAEVDSNKKAKADNGRLQTELRKLEAQKAEPPPTIDLQAINNQLSDLKRRIADIRQEQSTTSDQIQDLQERGRQRQVLIKQEQQKRVHMQSQAGKMSSQIHRFSTCSSKLWDWMQTNRDKFSSDIFGPVMVECSLKNRRYAKMVETAIGDGSMKAFTVRNRQDFNRLTDQGLRNMKLWDLAVNVSTQSPSDFARPLTDEALAQLGLKGWVVDLLDGPDAVLAMLCGNNNLHLVPYAEDDLPDDRQFEAIKRAGITRWVTPNKMYTVARRYNYESTRVVGLNDAKYFTDAPVNTEAEENIGRRISELKDEITQIASEITGVKTRDTRLKNEAKQLEEERDAIVEDKKEKQRKITAYQGLDTKIANYEEKLRDAQATIATAYSRIRAIKDREMDLVISRGQQALNYARLVGSLRQLHEQLYDVEIMRIEAQSDAEQLTAQHQEETALLAQREAEVNRLTLVSNQLREQGRELQERLQQMSLELTEAENALHGEISDKLPEELETMIEEQKASLDALGQMGSRNLIKEYQERAQKIEQKHAQLRTLEAELAELDDKITEIRERWEPELEELIGQISDAFAENFSRIQCAGEVEIHKDEDFEQWAIQIKVKFRENESLEVLDSHRQSGGERAVSTIFYLMALQSLARAPFRVVDEINQGMDPRNERLVHSRMVDIACAEHTSQYFLITPKLLNGLKYHRNMKVHCIASGEYMPPSSKEQGLETFEQMALRAMAIRNRA